MFKVEEIHIIDQSRADLGGSGNTPFPARCVLGRAAPEDEESCDTQPTNQKRIFHQAPPTFLVSLVLALLEVVFAAVFLFLRNLHFNNSVMLGGGKRSSSSLNPCMVT